MITMKAQDWKKTFFDRQPVIDAMERAERRNLSKAGAFVRTKARSSIRKRKKPAPPGKPPSSHTGDLRRGILFGYDQRRHSVVVGAMAFNSKRITGTPEILEKGGRRYDPDPAFIKVKNKPGRDAAGRFVSGGESVVRVPPGVRRYPARPFMQPALEAEQPNFPRVWRNSVRR